MVLLVAVAVGIYSVCVSVKVNVPIDKNPLQNDVADEDFSAEKASQSGAVLFRWP